MHFVFLALLAVVAGVAFAMRGGKGEAATMQNQPAGQPTIAQLYIVVGQSRGVDPLLLRAICIVESSENPNAENPSDPSVGLGQVLCRFDPADPERRCLNRFNVEGWERATWNALKDPAFNLDIAAQILKWNLDSFGFPRGVAVYNAWESRHAGVAGPFPNQGYVDKVLKVYSQLKGA